MKKKLIALLAASIFAAAPAIPVATAMSWSAQQMTVHEWGVQVFDWSGPRSRPALPPFIHTDVTPGIPVPAPEKRIKDLPPDNGMRFKPLLYFYPPARELGESAVGVELRFAYGHAGAWYPQANIYRTPIMTAGAKEPDWEAWRKASNAASLRPVGKTPIPVPDDPRMELVWSRLTLSKELPKGASLPEVPDNYWIKTAQEVQSAYVSNGNETEKFLFYEGVTREKPAIAIVPGSDGDIMGRNTSSTNIVNVADTPIYNVFAIYHQQNRFWVGYISVLEPFKIAAPAHPGSAGTTIAALPLPDFHGDVPWTDERSLPQLTADRLIGAITEGGAMSINRGLRDPADPQGPTFSAQLFPEEAKALEKIWHDDFFNSDGLTILYRESPAALDKAMPLNIYTDMYHYVTLSRCGLVLNKNIQLTDISAVYYGIPGFASRKAEDKKELVQTLKENRLLAEGTMAYMERLGRDPKEFAEVRTALAEK